MKKIFTIALLALAGLLALALLLCLAAFAALYSEAGRDWALARAQSELKTETGIVLEYEAARGRLPVRLILSRVRLSQKGRVIFSAKSLTLAPNLAALLAGRIGVGLIRLEDPDLALPFPDFGPEGSGGSALPLGIFIRRVELKNARINPNREWGPVELLEGVDLSGRLRLNRSGFRFEAENLAGLARLEGFALPVRVTAKARLTSLDQLEIDSANISLGKNRAEVSGSLNWKDDLLFKARVKGGFNDPGALPAAWPGPHPPRSEIGFSLDASGKIDDCGLNGLLSLDREELGFSGRLNLATLAGNIELSPKSFNPVNWGLAEKDMLVSGNISARAQGSLFDPGARVDLSLELPALSLPGMLQASVKAEAAWQDKRLDLKALEAKGGWGEIKAKASYAPATVSRGEKISVEAKFSRLSPPPGLAKLLPEKLRRPSLNGALTAGGNAKSLDIDLKLDRSEVMPGLALDSLSIRAGLDELKPSLKELELSLAGARLRAEGKADAKTAGLSFRLAAPDLKPLALALAGFAPEFKSIEGANLSAEGRLAGAWTDPALDLTLTADSVKALSRRLDNLRLKADLRRLGPKPLGRLNLAAESLFTGDVKLESIAIGAVSGPDGLNLEASTKSRGWKGEVGLTASGLIAGDIAATINRLRLTPPGKKPWSLEKPARLKVDRSEIMLRELTLRNQKQSISIQGLLKHTKSEVDCTLKIGDFKPGPWLGEKNLFPGAHLNFKASLSGRLDDPVIEMRGRFSGLSLPKLPVMSLGFKGDYARNKMFIGGQVATAGRSLLDLRANLDIGLSLSPIRFLPEPDGMVDVGLTGNDLPIHLFQPFLSGVSQLEGILGAHLKAKGPWRKVELSGGAELSGGGCMVDSTGQIFKGLNAGVSLTGRRISIDHFSLKSKGELKLAGQAILPGRDRAGLLDLRLTGKDFMVLLGNYGEADLETDITLDGDFINPRLKGTVRPERVRLSILERPSDDLDEVVILKPGQKPPPILKDTDPGEFNPQGFLGRSLIDLNLDLSQGLKLKAKQGWLEVSGGATLRKQPFLPMRYLDKIILKQGLVMLSGKRLTINGGSVDFGGKTVPDPALNLEATYSANSATIFITVAGTAQKPNLQLTSQPPMSRTDILSTVIFGKPANSLSTDQNDRFQGAALALLGQQGVNLMRKFMGNTLTPDVVTVHNQDSGSSALEAGKYLSPDLYLRYRQDLGEDGGRNVGLEYRLKPWISLESQVGTTRDTGMDVIFNFDF